MLLLQLLFSIIAVVAESARRHREKMGQKARRLYYVKSRKLVAAPSIKKGEFHLFLSHVVSRWRETTSHGTLAALHSLLLATEVGFCCVCLCLPLSGAPRRTKCVSSSNGCSR